MIDLKKEEMHEIIAKNIASLLDNLCKKTYEKMPRLHSKRGILFTSK